jgi:hypothetical protein
MYFFAARLRSAHRDEAIDAPQSGLGFIEYC